MNISVIIPTYNGIQKIYRILNSLSKQSYNNFETIVVVDGSTDGTVDYLNNRNWNLQKLKIINQENQGRAIVRNNGAAIAEGEILIFFDDDMKLDEKCIENHYNHHQKHINTILAGSIAEDPSFVSTDIQKYKCFLNDTWNSPLLALKDKAMGKENLYLSAGNFSIEKCIFFKLEGFDIRLKDAEDWDLAVRAFVAKIPIYYNHDALAWHHDPLTCSSYIKRQKEYKNYHKKLLKLKPVLYRIFDNRNQLNTTISKKIIYGIFSLKIWPWLVDSFNIFIVLPKMIRYKFYGIIVTAPLENN